MPRNIIEEQQLIRTLPDETLQEGLSRPSQESPFTQYLGAIEVSRRVRQRKAAAAAKNAADINNGPVLQRLVQEAQAISRPQPAAQPRQAAPAPTQGYAMGGLVRSHMGALDYQKDLFENAASVQQNAMMKQFGIDRALEKPGDQVVAGDASQLTPEERARLEQVAEEQEGTLNVGRRGIMFNQGGIVPDVPSYADGGIIKAMEAARYPGGGYDPIIARQMSLLGRAKRREPEQDFTGPSMTPGLADVARRQAIRQDEINRAIEAQAGPDAVLAKESLAAEAADLTRAQAMGFGDDVAAARQYIESPPEVGDQTPTIIRAAQAGHRALWGEEDPAAATGPRAIPNPLDIDPTLIQEQTLYGTEGAADAAPEQTGDIPDPGEPPKTESETEAEKTQRYTDALMLATAANAFANNTGTFIQGATGALQGALEVGLQGQANKAMLAEEERARNAKVNLAQMQTEREILKIGADARQAGLDSATDIFQYYMEAMFPTDPTKTPQGISDEDYQEVMSIEDSAQRQRMMSNMAARAAAIQAQLTGAAPVTTGASSEDQVVAGARRKS